MKKKYLIIALFTILLVHPIQTLAQNWFPSEVGNEWQYIDKYWSENPNYSSFSIGLWQHRILEDTVLNNTRYFKFSMYNRWLTFSESDQKLYIRHFDSNLVYMDFNVFPDSVFDAYHPEVGFCELTARENTFNWLDTTFIEKGLKYYEGTANNYDMIIESFIPNFGYQSYLFWERNWPYYHREHWGHLIQANINGIHYSEDYFPEIFIYDFSVNSSHIDISIIVNHGHNQIFYWEFDSFIYIDSVKFYSFYSKQDSIVNNPVILAEYLISSEWSCYIDLDMNLMENGFSFNYRIEAIDRGLVPRRSFEPDSGYFVYTITDVSDNLKPTISYDLHQNYPNPFNPNTKIKFVIPKSSFVNLKVYNVLGKEAATLVNEEKPAGNYEVEFNATDLPSGIYFYRLQAGDFIETKKMILLR